MDNTLENKAKFFAQYWGQKVRFWKGIPGRLLVVSAVCLENNSIIDSYLQLKSLSAISDKDAIRVSEILSGRKIQSDIQYYIDDTKDQLNKFSVDGFLKCDAIDYLRSKAYLLPFNGLSCEEILKDGWAVLESEVSHA